MVAMGGIIHESNSFNRLTTSLADFDVTNDPRQWAHGLNEVAGFAAARRVSFRIHPSMVATATPKGPVEPSAFETLTRQLVEGILAAPRLDGVYLALHGALYTPRYPHGDEEIVRRVRAAIGPKIPLVVTHDFHANITPELATLTTALIVYKTNPHVDQYERGEQAARVMDAILKGEAAPVQTIVKPRIFWNIVFQNTGEAPLDQVARAIRQAERAPGVMAASFACGYQYNDCAHMGPAIVMVTNGNRALARTEARRIARTMEQLGRGLALDLPNAREAVRQAIAAKRHPVAILDAGDNVGGGSAADSTFLLQELVRQNAEGWVVVLDDPDAVRVAEAAGVGRAFQGAVGGKKDRLHGAPVRIRGRVRSLHDGRFTETQIRHGGWRFWEMGRTAVIEVEGSTRDLRSLLVLTSQRTMPFSLRQLTSLGIETRDHKIIVVKGTIAPRAAYERHVRQFILADTPGSTAVNPGKFRYRRATAPPK